MSDRESVELTTVRPEDARNFRIGATVYIEHGRILRGWRLRWYLIRSRARHWTRWWRTRDVVTAIDRETGSITVALERWSWRRWRWERVA